MVRNKHYFIEAAIAATPAEAAQINAGEMGLVGWLYYVDAFGVRHRAGYARHINPTIQTGNNLTWDHASARHNYDEELDEQGRPKTHV